MTYKLINNLSEFYQFALNIFTFIILKKQIINFIYSFISQ